MESRNHPVKPSKIWKSKKLRLREGSDLFKVAHCDKVLGLVMRAGKYSTQKRRGPNCIYFLLWAGQSGWFILYFDEVLGKKPANWRGLDKANQKSFTFVPEPDFEVRVE